MKRITQIALLGLFYAVSAMADEQLWALLEAQEAASGQFIQELYDEEGELLERSSGHYAILRPGFFRWEIDYPDRQLLLVSGDLFWHYDIDLATATRRKTGDDQSFAPLALLGGDLEELRGRFRVTRLGEGEFQLQPTYPAAGFALVEMHWDGPLLRAMEILDRSGQRLQLALEPAANPVKLASGDFQFSVPEGVEVFYDDGV